MTDSKNIVIKVKYTPPNAGAESQPRIITEWNVKRIAGALTILILLLGALYFVLRGKSRDMDNVRNAAPSSPIEAPVPPPPASAAKPQETPVAASTPDAAGTTIEAKPSPPEQVKASQGGRVRRTALAYRIVDKEPADLIGSTVSVSRTQPVLVHYFTEVRGKTDQTLFHEWRKDGQLILRHPMTISAARWRTSSQRQLGPEDQGHWSVRAVDDQGGIMNEMQFTVSAK
ncbi:DUF2914 domain-containing protein [Methylomicrobium lacus]|uniref:DUF2914 domain-containing protein n=1 Tax=Methylomicrobium lacus TaxID=136992 RepID=UPI000A0035E7|nr:DUF2914 domain-containing protein [Methylomicrobium lacus]